MDNMQQPQHYALTIKAYATREQQARAVGEQLAAMIREVSEYRHIINKKVVVALAGGETPKPAYAALAQCSLGEAAVTIIPTDERCVAADNARRNDAVLRNALASFGEQVRVLSLTEQFENNTPLERPNIMLLGMGEDGHVGSIFADTLRTDETDEMGEEAHVYQVQPAAADEPRLAVPLSLLANTRMALLMINGSKKWELLRAPSPPFAAFLSRRQHFNSGVNYLPPLEVYYAD